MSKTIFLHAARVPNPDALKFELENIFITDKVLRYRNKAEASNCPLAEKLFGFTYVTEVLITRNFITINKNPNIVGNWDEVMNDLRIMVRRHFELDEPVFLSEPIEDPMDTPEGIESQIHVALEQKIRPAAQGDGGDIQFLAYDDGVVAVRMRGACHGCPYAPQTIKKGIEPFLKSIFPEVVSVTSPDVDWANTQQE